MDANLCPQSLLGAGLSFTEMIYATAFELENEIHIKGKDKIFEELGLTMEQMQENVREVIKWMRSKKAYALIRVFGDQALLQLFANLRHDQNAKELEISMVSKEDFEEACEDLRSDKSLCWCQDGTFKTYRYALLGDQFAWGASEAGFNIDCISSFYELSVILTQV